MNRNLRLIIGMLSALVYSLGMEVSAIEPTWEIKFGSVFDNREGDDRYYEDKTFFMTVLAPEVGLRFTPRDRIAGGAVWTQPLENGVKDGKIVPTLYYRHESDRWSFSMGMFPRTQLYEELPGYLWNDSLSYFQKNIRGALVQYNHRRGYFEAYLDWRQMQTETRREAFNIVFHGEWRPKGVLLLGGHLMMNHYAKTRHADESQSIVDNFMVNPYVGVDLSRKTALDSLYVKGGMVMTVERYRAHNGWKTPAGFQLDAGFEWKFLGLRNSLYVGGNLLPLYGEFGPQVYQGESYYQSKLYDRADVYAKIYRNKYMNLEAQLNFHITKESFMFYQRLMLEVELGN